MQKTEIKQILLEQRDEIALLLDRPMIERESLSKAKEAVDTSLAKIIMGVRRCGKSVLSHQMLQGRPYAYINFDDERLISVTAENLNDFFEAAKEIDPSFKHILLDEIQNTTGWELFVNRLLRNGYNPIITGSNSTLLSKELATHLTGRQLSINLFPFSFREFLVFHNIAIPKDGIFSTEKRAEIKSHLEKYIRDGGFPEVHHMDMKALYLRELFDKIVTKDIVLRYNIKYVRYLKEMALYLLSNFASLATYHKIKNTVDIKSIHTIKNYTHYLAETYLIFELTAFSFKHKERIKLPRKIYCIDTGMINAVAPKTSLNIGRLMENLVFVELMRRGKEIYYYSDGYSEVDFLIKKELRVTQLMQVCYVFDKANTAHREIKALIKARKKLSCDNLTVITWDDEGQEVFNGTKIKIIPLWKWLLDGV